MLPAPAPPPGLNHFALSALGLVFLLAAAAPAGAEVVNRVVLRVNDRIATLHEYAARKADLEGQLLRQQDMPLERRRDLLNHLGVTVFRDMFEEMLLLSRADQTDLKVTEDEVDAAVARMRKNFQLEDDNDFAAALAQNGMTPDQLREQVRRNLRIQTLLGREVQSEIQIDEEVLRRYYRDHPEEFEVPEQVRLQELVVLDDSKLSAGERAELAATLRAGLVAGRPPSELADEHSRDGATSGLIDIGWVSRGDLSPDLEQAVWDLQPGEVTAPVAARGGLHLLRVEERREAALKPFADVADEIRAHERGRLFDVKYKEYLDRLEREAYVQIDPPAEAKDFRLAAAAPADVAPGLGAAAEQAAEQTVAAQAAGAAEVEATAKAAAERRPSPGDPFPSTEEPEAPAPDETQNLEATPDTAAAPASPGPG